MTLEASPGSVTAERAAAWRQAGINRVSLGVQSFVPAEAARTGRKHTPEQVAAEVEILRSAGIGHINIDLIAGLAGQTADSWDASLGWLLRVAPDHASVYMLEVDEDSRLGQEVLLGGVRYGARDVPSDGLIADCYETAVDRLAEAGLFRYEISNFARPGSESRHNLKYWRREPYLGFGADAHSFDGKWRWSTSDDVRRYIEGAPASERVVANAAEERLFLGLRLMEGIEAGEVNLRNAETRGLLERREGRLRLTRQGVLLSNEVFEECIQ
jgi:oxygen-independent coproporphyrinogen-3 oxidase